MAFNPFEENSNEFNPFDEQSISTAAVGKEYDKPPQEPGLLDRLKNAAVGSIPGAYFFTEPGRKVVAGNSEILSPALAGGVGDFIVNTDKAFAELGRPTSYTPEEWAAKTSNSVRDFGENLRQGTDRQYEPYSKEWYAYNLARMAPTSLGLAVAAGVAMRTGNPQLVNQEAAALASRLGVGARMANVASKLGAGAKVAEAIEGGAAPLIGEAAGGTYIGSIEAVPEAVMEGQQAFDDAYKDALSQGMTQEEADEHATKVKNFVTDANVALLAGTNAAEIVAGLGKLPFKLPKSTIGKLVTNAGRIGVAGVSESAQEGVQQILPKIAEGRSWSPFDTDVKEAAALGFGSGVLFGGAGRIIDSARSKQSNQVQTDTADQLRQAITGQESGGKNGDYPSVSEYVDQVMGRLGQDQTPARYTLGADVDFQGLKADTQSRVESLVRAYNKEFQDDPITISDANRAQDAGYGAPNSWHKAGEAADFVSPGLESDQVKRGRFIELAKQHGFREVLDEYSNPSSYATGGHVHIGGLGENRYTGISVATARRSSIPYYTAEEKRQAVRWLDDQAQKTDDVEDYNKITQILNTGDIDNALVNFTVDTDGQKIPLGKFLFPGKVNANTVASQTPDLSGVSVNTARAAVDNAQQALNATQMETPKPFMEPGRTQQTQNLANVLNNITANKFDQAEAAKAPLPSRTEPVKSQKPYSPFDVQQRLGQVTGQQAAQTQIVTPNQANEAGIKAVEELRQRLLPKQEKLASAEELVLKRAIMQAVSRKDYTAAANLARQLGREDKVKLYENLMPQTRNPREHLTADDIKRRAEYERLDDMEKLFVDALEHYKAPLHGIEFELENSYNNLIDDYAKILQNQVKQPGVKSVKQNMSGDKFTRTYSQNYKWFMDLADQHGYSANKLPKGVIDQAIRDIALDHLRNGYTDPLYGPQLSEEEVNKFNELEAALNGVRQVRDRVSPALSGELRPSESSIKSNAANIQQAARDTVPIAKELGAGQVREELLHYHPEYASNKEALNLAGKAIQLTINFDGETEIRSVKEEYNLQNSKGLPTDNRRQKPDGTLRSNPAKGQFIGYGITKELINNGVVSLVGKTAQSPEQLAEISQVLRHPGYETFHVIYVKNDTVVHHEAVSSRLPGVTSIFLSGENSGDFLYRLYDTIEKVGADGYYFVHNHPSGHPEPSPEDTTMTRQVANIKTSEGSDNNPVNKGFKGHVVINSNAFAVIDGNGNHTIQPLKPGGKDRLLSPSIDHPALGEIVNSSAVVARVAKSIQLSPEQSVVFYLSQKNEIRAVQVVPNEILLSGENKATRYLRWSTRATFSAKPVIVTDSNVVFEATKPLVEKGYVLDSYHSSKQITSRNDGVRVAEDKTWMGQKIPGHGVKVLEGENGYTSKVHSNQSFAKQLDNWAAGKLPPRTTLVVGRTPDVLVKLGVKQLPLEISQKVVEKVAYPQGVGNGKHDLGLDLLKKLPEQLDDPIMVFKSATQPNSMVVLTELSDKQGRRVIVAIKLNAVHNHNIVNAVASMYGRNNEISFIKKEITEGRLLYHNKEKSRALVPGKEATIASGSNSTHDSINIMVQQEPKHVKENEGRYEPPEIEEARQKQHQYLEKHGPTININTSERQALRKKIANELYGTGAKNKNRQVYFVLGLPASGKSSVSDPLAERTGSLIIDSDMAKERLPEFNNGKFAGVVHDESSLIADNVLDRAMSSGDNIILPLVGKSISKIQNMQQALKSAGYDTHLIYVHLPVKKAVSRAIQRFKETGRFVDPQYVSSVGYAPLENYDILKIEGSWSSYEAYSNDVKRGEAPELLERNVAGRGYDSRSVHQNSGETRSGETRSGETENRTPPGGVTGGGKSEIDAPELLERNVAGRRQNSRENYSDAGQSNRETKSGSLKEKLNLDRSGKDQGDFTFKDNTDYAKKLGNKVEESAKFSSQSFSDSELEQVLDIRFISEEKILPDEQAIIELGQQMGVPVRFFIAKQGLRGFHVDGVTYINRNGNRGIEWAFWHETLHWLKNQNPELYQTIIDSVQRGEKISPEQIAEYRETIGLGTEQDESGEYLMSDEEIIEEMLGDEMADVASRRQWMQELYNKDKSLFDRFVEWLKEAAARLKGRITGKHSQLTNQQAKEVEKSLRNVLLALKDASGNRALTDRTQFPYMRLEPQYSQSENVDGQAFAKQLDDWAEGKLIPRVTILVGRTPDILIKIGAKQLPLEISQKVVEKVVNSRGMGEGKHGLGLDLLKKLPEQLNNPIMVFESATQPNSIVVLTELVDNQNRSVIAAIALEREHGRHSVNAIASIYGRNNDLSFIKNQIDAGRLLYQNKEKSRVWFQSREATIASGVESQKHNSINSIVQQDPKDVNKDDIKYSADSEYTENSVSQATANLAQNLGLKPAENVTYIERPADDGPGIARRWLNSVNVIANKHPKLKPFFHLASKAMETQEKLRQHFQHRLQKVEQVLGNTGFMARRSEAYKENKASLYQILLDGDANEKNYTSQELRDLGYNDQVVRAYNMIRAAYSHAWKLANEIRQGIETKSENMTAAKFAQLKQNKFVEILSEKQKGEDNYLVTWKQPKISEYAVTLTKDELDLLKQDPNAQIISEKPLRVTGHALPQAAGLTHGDEFYEVEYRSQKPPIANRSGYVPHFFHEWFVMKKDKEGNTEILFSARKAREALKKANEYTKQNPDMEIVVKPKQFKFPGADMNAAVMGDMNYFKMVNKVSDDLEISLDDARQFLDGKVHMKNRYRFVGNFLQRKGANGWEQDLDWVNRHYFNMVSRYVAMDPFKSKSISLFERFFGQYALDYDGLGRYVKHYINDINGVPSEVERALNDALNGMPWINKFLGEYLGERPAAQLASAITDAVAVLKLGMYNISSAIIQTTQFINVASSMNSYDHAFKGLAMAIKPNGRQRLLLHRTGVDTNLSMESGAGYSKAGQMKKWFQGTTAMFRYLDVLMRRAATLGAYSKAIEEGKSPGAALEYAKEVNQKANFEYGVHDAPDIFRRSGPVGQIALQFKKYPIKQFELMADLAKHGDIRQNAKFWVPMLLLAGIWSIPAIGVLKIFANLFDWDWEKETKAALMNWAGDDKARQALAKTAMYGIMSNAGVDISRRTGMGDVIPMETRDLFGPVAGTLYQTGVELSRSNWSEAVKAVSPGIGNALVALAGETRGTRGRVKTQYETYGERLLKGMGFMPIKESVDRDKESVTKYLERECRGEEEAAIDDYIRAYKSGDNSARQKAAERLSRLRVSTKRVRDEMARKDKTNVQRGEENISNKQREKYRQIMSFE